MSYADEIMGRKYMHRLKDLNVADLKMDRLNLANSLNDIVGKINNFQQEHSATYYQVRFNYSYINKDLCKEEMTLIIKEFAELEKRFANILKEDARLKEDLVLIKADLLEKAELWNKARTAVDKDLIERRRAVFWKKSDKETKQQFTEADFHRLRKLEEMYGNKKGLECLQKIEKMMSVENPFLNLKDANNDKNQPTHSILDKLNEITNRKGIWRLKDRGYRDSKEVKIMERERV